LSRNYAEVLSPENDTPEITTQEDERQSSHAVDDLPITSQVGENDEHSEDPEENVDSSSLDAFRVWLAITHALEDNFLRKWSLAAARSSALAKAMSTNFAYSLIRQETQRC
jgi:hypothetical protein